MPVKVAIVEDQAEVRDEIATLLNSDDRFQCCGAYGAAEEAIDEITRNKPDIVLMDIELPGMSGIDCIRRLTSAVSDLRVMMLTVFEDDEKIFRALKAGASGYLVKNTEPQKILEAIHDLQSGGAPMSNQIARRVLACFREDSSVDKELLQLSDRERQVLELLADGLIYKEIADRLNISLPTVRTHIHNIYEKLHVQNKAEAIKKMRRRRNE